MTLDPKDRIGRVEIYRKKKTSFGDVLGGVFAAIIIFGLIGAIFG